MSVAGFDRIMEGPLAKYLVVSRQIGGDVATHSALVEQAFQAQLRYLVISNLCEEASQMQQASLLKPTSQHIRAIQGFTEHHPNSVYKNHLSTISESISALGWIIMSHAPSSYIKEMKNGCQFYTDRVLKDWKKKDEKHVHWVRAWVQTLSNLEMYVKKHYATGFMLSNMNVVPACTSIPLLRPHCPLPFLAFLDDPEINPRRNTAKNLKKATADVQTQTTEESGRESIPTASGENVPVFSKDGNKWRIEYKENNAMLIQNAQMDDVVYLNKCVDSTLEVEGKINSITVDSCKKTTLVFESVVSCVELINCQSIQMQVSGSVPKISIDKTDGCQITLIRDSLAAEIISTESSNMNVIVP